MKKLTLLFLLITGGLCQVSSAQFFLGVGANAQFTGFKDSYLSADARAFLNEEDEAQLTWSPALRMEYVLSANAYVSSTFSHLQIKDYGYTVPATNSTFTADKVRGIQGRIMGGWVFDHWGLEGGVVLLQSYQNDRTLVTPSPDPLNSMADITTTDKGFTQLYPSISVTYKYGQWLGVLSGTFSSDRFRPSGQELTTVAPQSSASFGVFYIWKAVAAPRLASPRF